ncbi:MAG TPA: hypothetical protein VES39_05835, partial [Rhodospirillales bacterium]|nr:hypothetical protein [Rhodospirillales bacterium]
MRTPGRTHFCALHQTRNAPASPAPATSAAAGAETSQHADGSSRRDFLIGAGAAGTVTALVASTQALAAGLAGDLPPGEPATVLAAVTETPIGPRWWPSRWGADDEAGASNWITPAKVLAAAQLIRTGRMYEMGRVAQHEM